MMLDLLCSVDVATAFSPALKRVGLPAEDGISESLSGYVRHNLGCCTCSESRTRPFAYRRLNRGSLLVVLDARHASIAKGPVLAYEGASFG